MNELNQEINVAIFNQAQRDMTKKFGWFVMMFLFWLPKYDKWYLQKIKTIRKKLEAKVK